MRGIEEGNLIDAYEGLYRDYTITGLYGNYFIETFLYFSLCDLTEGYVPITEKKIKCFERHIMTLADEFIALYHIYPRPHFRSL